MTQQRSNSFRHRRDLIIHVIRRLIHLATEIACSEIFVASLQFHFNHKLAQLFQTSQFSANYISFIEIVERNVSTAHACNQNHRRSSLLMRLQSQ